MKNSVWYHKLWRKKLDQLPASGDADQAWADMAKMLDEHLPVKEEKSNKVVKPLVAKLITLLGYALPAAAMIGAASYFVAPVFHKPKSQQRTEKHSRTNKNRAYPQRSTGAPVPFDQPDTVSNDSLTRSTQINKDVSVANTMTESTETWPVTGTDRKAIGARSVSAGRSASLTDPSPLNRRSVYSHSGAKAKRDKGADERNIGIAEIEPVDQGAVQNDRIAPQETVPANSVTQEPKTDQGEQVKQETVAVSSQKGIKPSKAAKKTKEKPGSRAVSKFNFGLEAGLNAGSGKASPYGGLFLEYAFHKKWLISTGLRVMSRSVSGVFTHPSYYRPDSSAFSINDERRLMTLTIPIQLTYRVNDHFSIGAGPLISINSKQPKVSNSFSTITDRRDTLSHTGKIDTALRSTTFNKINVGAAVGASYRLDRLSIDARYQLLSPDKVSNTIGNYSRSSHSIQVGVSYRFK
ncbi:PorT family protein [Mucilaginibacter daejeonensis]|uniref:porin family protein n=1 Tax=Mucilaginibacter daejeonensis TaxID=398049 RepID=UPI001D1711C3|nr:porin family protein [Mucilaginibacter daejeonensis]UEG53093.1 PorT family protein [Mucilaginibacter daejeonensis]